jgi:pimeloyl-ACP methyl ester carboxylesterase
MTYEPFMRAVLRRDDFTHVSFPYDWRKAFGRNTTALKDLILKTFTENKTRVHLVAHSMGGLLVRATLMEYERELSKAVGRIVFIGTPHYGAMVIGGYLKNHLWGFEMLALLGRYISRDTFRSLWGVLTLLPAPVGVYPGTRPGDPNPWMTPAAEKWFYDHPCANFDLYVADSWSLDINQQQKQELQRVLNGAADFHRRLHAWHQTLDAELAERMLMIAGVGYKALFRMVYRSHAFGLWSDMSKTTDRLPGDPHRDSDGRVPLASALLDNITTRYVTGVHGGLPNIPAVYNDVFNWLNQQPLQHLAKTAKDAVNVHLADPTGGSTAPNLDGTVGASGDDPGYWHDTDYGPVLDEIDASLPANPGAFHRVRLL